MAQAVSSETKPAAVIAPGKLRGSSNLVLHTRQAQQLYHGRKADPDKKKPEIIGLRRFSAHLSNIWSAMIKRDPFAWWWAYKIEQRLQKAENLIGDFITEFEGYLKNDHENLSHEESHSIEPVHIELIFSSPYSFRCAKLLADYDKLVRLVLTAHHVFAVDNQVVQKTLTLGGRYMRGAMESARGYYFRDVTFDDVVANNEKARAATEIMGEVPTDILDGKVKPSNTPNPMDSENSAFFGRKVTG